MDILSYKLGQNSIEPDKPDQSKTANPSTQTQVIRPDAGYELASVTINPVTSSIDENIIPSNIKKNVSILGVLGQLEEGAKGIYKVASIQERDDIENPEEGDICLVYQNEYVELTRDLEFNTFKIPNSFTFDEDMRGEPSRWYAAFFNSVGTYPITLSLDGNTGTGALINANTNLNSPSIEYIANNNVYTLGGTNTAIPETDYTLNKYIKLNSTVTDKGFRLLKSFIQPHISNFNGIYIYNNNQWEYLDIDIDTTASQVLQGKKAYTSSGIVTGTAELKPVETLEIYDYLDVNNTSTDMYETEYIPNQATETIVEFSNFRPMNISSTSTCQFFGVRVGTKTSFRSSSKWTSSYGVGSYNYGTFKFGNKEASVGSSLSILDKSYKTKFKFNDTGVYKYNYTNDTWETYKLFDAQATMGTISAPVVLFGNLEVTTIQGTQEVINNKTIGSTPLNIRFYTLEFYENGVLKAKYVPAKLGDTIGVYDTVAEKMLERATGVTIGNDE